MRLSDRPTTVVNLEIVADPNVIWPHIADINMSSQFSDEFQGAEWLDGYEAVAVGARFRGKQRHPVYGQWETTSYIVSCIPAQKLIWHVSDVEQPAAIWSYDLLPAASGTMVTHRGVIGDGPSGLSRAIKARPDREEKILGRRLDEWHVNMLRTVAGLKTLIEDGGQGSGVLTR